MFDAPDTGNYRATDHQSAPLYPPVEPFSHGWMEAGDGHRIYFEECGNPRGLPVVVLHGGPASGCSPLQRRFFDPEGLPGSPVRPARLRPQHAAR